MGGGYGSLYYINAVLERVTLAQKEITMDHAYIHEGIKYSCPILISALAAGATTKITFLTPSVASGKYVHFRPSAISTSGDKVTVNLYESSSGNSGGSNATAINRHRISANTALSAIKTGVTVTTNGTLIDQTYIGGGTGVGQARSGTEMGAEHEIILKQNTLHTIAIVNGSSAANNIAINLAWYEESGV